MTDSELENPTLGWSSCSREMRAGDLLVTVRNLYGSKFFPKASFCLVVGPAQDEHDRDMGCLSVWIDGVLEDMYPKNLEFIVSESHETR